MGELKKAKQHLYNINCIIYFLSSLLLVWKLSFTNLYQFPGLCQFLYVSMPNSSLIIFWVPYFITRFIPITMQFLRFYQELISFITNTTVGVFIYTIFFVLIRALHFNQALHIWITIYFRIKCLLVYCLAFLSVII